MKLNVNLDVFWCDQNASENILPYFVRDGSGYVSPNQFISKWVSLLGIYWMHTYNKFRNAYPN